MAEQLRGPGINPIDLESLKCQDCGGEVFIPAVVLKKLSSLLTQSGKDEVIPLQVFQCTNCGAIQEKFHEALSKGDTIDSEARQGSLIIT